MIQEDIKFVESVLPTHYRVHESARKGSIHCVSRTGMIKPGTVDMEDTEKWELFFSAIKKYFGKRFMVVDHNTCFCHVDFTIYLHPTT